ncbi:MAG TPA: GNAT family N-acetyltransferase [Candidatus Bathyarchaeia archaeon]|nr:GNAT family N-acetyltransferase [Candidatus Bathyarchaeia archaeon]
MNLRFATESDLPGLMALVNQAFQVERFFLIGDRLDPERTHQHFEKGRFLLLEEAGLAGCVYVELRGDRAYLGLLSVDPARQNSGLGRQLVSAAEEFAGQSGMRFMDLTVVSLRTELPPFYEKLGYTTVGTQPIHEDLASRVSQPCHLVRMSKPLHGAVASNP